MEAALASWGGEDAAHHDAPKALDALVDQGNIISIFTFSLSFPFFLCHYIDLDISFQEREKNANLARGGLR